VPAGVLAALVELPQAASAMAAAQPTAMPAARREVDWRTRIESPSVAAALGGYAAKVAG
jgi:hypothetical protein